MTSRNLLWSGKYFVRQPTKTVAESLLTVKTGGFRCDANRCKFASPHLCGHAESESYALHGDGSDQGSLCRCCALGNQLTLQPGATLQKDPFALQSGTPQGQ